MKRGQIKLLRIIDDIFKNYSYIEIADKHNISLSYITKVKKICLIDLEKYYRLLEMIKK